jgi:hypothetical protein
MQRLKPGGNPDNPQDWEEKEWRPDRQCERCGRSLNRFNGRLCDACECLPLEQADPCRDGL